MIYLDNQATTPLDPVALDAMLPFLREQFANAGSVTHQAGRQVAEYVKAALADIAERIGAEADELIITSGATESNNLALFGVLHHPRQKRRKIVSLVSEHKAILDPLKRLSQQGFEVQLVPVHLQSASTRRTIGSIAKSDDGFDVHSSGNEIVRTGPIPGVVDMDRLSVAIDDQTALVSIMLANNEIGVIQPLAEIAKLCREHGCYLHTDATQAVGRMAVNVDQLDVDLMSFSAHKFYGPKGVGGLLVRRRDRSVKLLGQIVGGGQQNNWRSGTLNTAGMIGMQAALQSCLLDLEGDQQRAHQLRTRLLERLQHLPQTTLNGPPLINEYRLAGNLNCCFYPLEGQSLMLHAPELAISSGSACTSANPEPSHVLQAIGLSEDQARSSLRFGIGRFNTLHDMDQAADMLIAAAKELLHSIHPHDRSES